MESNDNDDDEDCTQFILLDADDEEDVNATAAGTGDNVVEEHHTMIKTVIIVVIINSDFQYSPRPPLAPLELRPTMMRRLVLHVTLIIPFGVLLLQFLFSRWCEFVSVSKTVIMTRLSFCLSLSPNLRFLSLQVQQMDTVGKEISYSSRSI